MAHGALLNCSHEISDDTCGSPEEESAYVLQERLGFNPWAGEDPLRRELLPTSILAWNSYGLCSPKDRKESGMTERLTFTFTFKSLWRASDWAPRE